MTSPKRWHLSPKAAAKLDAAAIEYLYRLYITDVIPARPHVKIDGIELAVQMTAAQIPAARQSNRKTLPTPV